MVSLKEITVKLQICVDGQWMTCEEFDAANSVKEYSNSSTRLTTYVERIPGTFRFLIELSDNFEWAPDANALAIDLTFDEGDPISQYRVVVLGPTAANLTKQLGLPMMDVNSDGLSFCLEKIAMPDEAESGISPWYETSFEFKKYTQQDLTKFRTPKNPSKYKGKLNIDIRPCVAKRDPHSNASISLNPKLEPKWSTTRPREEVTLKPALKPDTQRRCGNTRQYKCVDSKGVKPVSFIFYYREPGTCEKIDVDEVDVVTEAQKSLQQDTPESTQTLSSRQSPAEPVSLPTSPTKQAGSNDVESTDEENQEPWSGDSSSSTVAVDSAMGDVHIQGLSSEDIRSDKIVLMAVEASEEYRKLRQAVQEQAGMDRVAVRKMRQGIRRELEKTKNNIKVKEDTVVEMTNALTAERAELVQLGAQLQDLQLQFSDLGREGQKLERRLQGESPSKDEDKRILATMEEGMQSFFDRLRGKRVNLERDNLKRRRMS